MAFQKPITPAKGISGKVAPLCQLDGIFPQAYSYKSMCGSMAYERCSDKKQWLIEAWIKAYNSTIITGGNIQKELLRIGFQLVGQNLFKNHRRWPGAFIGYTVVIRVSSNKKKKKISVVLIDFYQLVMECF